MATPLLNLIKARRTYYNITKKSPIPDARVVEIVKEAVLHTPSSFNSQSGRALVLFGTHHDKLWDGVKDILKALTPEEKYPETVMKIDGSFKAGHGTVLFFEDQRPVSAMQKQFPTYQDKFPQWSENSSGMLQFTVWTALEAEGLGCSLQHYNPVVDEFVKINWKIDEEWRLIAQMPFGTPSGPTYEKTFKPIDERVKVAGL